MKALQKVDISQLKHKGLTYIVNTFDYVICKPSEEAQSFLADRRGNWRLATDDEILADYLRTTALDWKVKIFVPNFSQMQANQGYTYFARQLHAGLSLKGVDFVEMLTPDVDMVLIINSVWQAGDPVFIESLKDFGKPIAMFTMFESDHWIEDHVNALKLLDFLIVPCQWNKETLIKQGYDKPIYVCPLPNNQNFTYQERPGKRDFFNFLHYNAGDYRKGFPEYLDAFLEEFSGEKDVFLTLKTRKYDDCNKNFDFARIHTNSQIHIIREDYGDYMMQELHKDSDCFIFPSKGEGWGYPPIEALLTGNPVIVPKQHAFKDWFNNACIEVKTELEPASFSIYGEKQEGTGNWYKPKVVSLRKAMRSVYDAYKKEGRDAQIFKNAKKQSQIIAKNYSQSAIADLFIDILVKIKIISN